MMKLDTFCTQICIFQVSLKISQTFLIVLAEAGASVRAKQFLRKLLSMPLLPLTTGKNTEMVLRYGATYRTKCNALPPLSTPPTPTQAWLHPPNVFGSVESRQQKEQERKFFPLSSSR